MATRKKTGRARKGTSGSQKRPVEDCFVIMPFKDPFNLYEEVVKPSVRKAGLKPIRGDEISKPGAIIHQVWDAINDAQVCIADLTGLNENVMYELGLAHAVGKPVVQLAQSSDEIPFDLRALRTIIYHPVEDDEEWKEWLKNEIHGQLTGAKEDKTPEVLPVASSRASFGTSSVEEYYALIERATRRIWICQTWFPGVGMYAEKILGSKARDIRVLLASFKPGSPIFARIAGRRISADVAKAHVFGSVQKFVREKRTRSVRFNFGHHPGWIAIIDSSVLWGPTPVDVDNHSRNIFFYKDSEEGKRGAFWIQQFSSLWDNRGGMEFSHSFDEEKVYNAWLRKKS